MAAPYSPSDMQSYYDAIDDAERRKGLPRGLARAVAMKESSMNPNAIGDSGRAVGFFQLHPPAAQDVGLSAQDRYDPFRNIEGGTSYLALKLKQAKGDVNQALRFYNGGGDPNYVQNVNRFYGGGLAGTQYAQAGEPTLSDMPRYAGRASGQKQAASRPDWMQGIPEEPPAKYATQPAVTPPTATQPAPSAGKPDWMQGIPEEPPAKYVQPPTPERPSAVMQAPAPAPTGPAPDLVQAATPAPTPTTPAPNVVQAQAPAPQQGGDWFQQQLQQTQPWLQQQEAQQQLQTGMEQQQAVQTPEQRRDTRARLEKQMEEEARLSSPTAVFSQDPAVRQEARNRMAERRRAITAGAADIGYSAAGAIAGGLATGGNPAAIVAGGIGGQAIADRLKRWAGVSPEEKPIAQLAPGIALYESDLLNVGFGLLTGAPSLYKMALSKTMAGKAILNAETSTARAFKEWKDADQAALALQGSTDKQAYEAAVLRARVKQNQFVDEWTARNKTIQANESEYRSAKSAYAQDLADAKVKDQELERDFQQRWQHEMQQGYEDVRRPLVKQQEQYATDVAQREATIEANKQADILAQQRYQTKVQSAEDLQRINVEEAERERLETAQKRVAAQAGPYEREVQARQEAVQEQATAQQQMRSVQQRYAPEEPSHVLYERAAKEAHGQEVPMDPGKQRWAAIREKHPKDLNGKPLPLESEVQFYADQLEKAGESGSVEGIWAAMKELGPLTRARHGPTRGQAKQLYGVYADLMEQSPTAGDAIKAANRNWRKEEALKDFNEWISVGRRGAATRNVQAGQHQINLNMVKNKIEGEMNDPNSLWAKSFTPEELDQLYAEVSDLAGTTRNIPPREMKAQPPQPLSEVMAETEQPKVAERPAIGVPPRPTPEPSPIPPPDLSEVKALPGSMRDLPAEVRREPPTTVGPEPVRAPDPNYPTLPGQERYTRQEIPRPETPEWAGRREVTDPATGKVSTEYTRTPEGMAPQLGERAKIWSEVKEAGTVGGLAYLLTRAGMNPGQIDHLLIGGGALQAGRILKHQADYMISYALMNDKFRPYLRAAVLSQVDPATGRTIQTLDPRFFGVMHAVMNKAEKEAYRRYSRAAEKEAEREQEETRAQIRARRR